MVEVIILYDDVSDSNTSSRIGKYDEDHDKSTSTSSHINLSGMAVYHLAS